MRKVTRRTALLAPASGVATALLGGEARGVPPSGAGAGGKHHGRGPAAIEPPSPAQVGQWTDTFEMPNVAVHANLLPSGQVLLWGRRDEWSGGLDDHFCTPLIWDPQTKASRPVSQPRRVDGSTVNLFCAGHSFLPDGRLLIAGGHIRDGFGLDQACLFDPETERWTPLPDMNNGRWYPTVVTLANGHCLVLSGSFGTEDGRNQQNNNIPQLWDGVEWHTMSPFPGDGAFHSSPIELFPCSHVAPDGRVFISGPAAQSWWLDTNGEGSWTRLSGPGGVRDNARRDYAPSVMYDVGRIVYMGGGNNPAPAPEVPTNAVEVIDLNVERPAWRRTHPMHFPRRQHNATLLPDGTVLVTGGTRGVGFNDVSEGQPVHVAELWDPRTERWTQLASESVDRCYHSTAVLLPDATVLSAGGGEFDIGNHVINPTRDSHRNAQIFRPPYLFRGARPEITDAPTMVSYGQTFTLRTPTPKAIARISLVRLASVTHTQNMNQRINFIDFEVSGNVLRALSPSLPERCPPGHYMLFALNRRGVPSVAKIIHLAPPRAPRMGPSASLPPRTVTAQVATLEHIDRALAEAAKGTQAVLGLTSKCPYGLGACWGGAYEALSKLDGVSIARPVANAADSTADVFLGTDVLPDVARWAEQITATANGSYTLRGVEVSISGELVRRGRRWVLTGPTLDGLPLRPLGTANKVQFDRTTMQSVPATAEEQAAYDRLVASVPRATRVRVTGPLVRVGDAVSLHVREFAVG